MAPQNEWRFFHDVDWNCLKNNRFNVDTRDFCVGYYFSDELHPDWSIISNYTRFFFTGNELKTLLTRLYNESRGDGEWRMLQLVSKDVRVLNWRLKYLRIFRTDRGFLICNSEYKALPKPLLNAKINQELLYHN